MPSPDKDFAKFLSLCRHDPLAFARGVYPALSAVGGPDKWQADVLSEIGALSRDTQSSVRLAVASGHGIGKTALVAWVIHWFLSTRPHPQVVVTANTRQQLEQKTWRELAKWHKASVHADMFEWTATKFYLKKHPETWFASATAWSADRSEAFAGTHEKHVLMIFDEASLIDDSIWEVTEGAMTTPGAIWLALGNPTRNTGRFAECFGRFRHRWSTRQIDSREAKMANRAQIEQWISDYGEDSDFVRVRVRGVFPRASSMQFVARDMADAAARRKIAQNDVRYAPVVIGVDVARFGDDASVIYVRQGLATLAVRTYREVDTITLGNLVARAEKEFGADAVFVDVVGIGAGVVDYLRRLGRDPIGVNAGERAEDNAQFANLRAEMWERMRGWLKAGGAIPDDPALIADLTGPEYGFDARDRLQMEKKEDMKRRGLASPDKADALAHTFAAHVEKQDAHAATRQNAASDYDVFGV